MSLVRKFVSVIVAIAALPIVSAAARAESGASRSAVYARVGALSEGPQGTLKRGLELGLGVERKRESGFAYGIGAGFARDRGRFDFDEYDSKLLSLEGHVRWSFGEKRVRPMLESGVGYYHHTLHELWRIGQPGYDATWSAPGGWLGVGAESRITEGVSARVGIAYHLIAQSVAIEGGNLEDYFATGLTLDFAGPTR